MITRGGQRSSEARSWPPQIPARLMKPWLKDDEDQAERAPLQAVPRWTEPLDERTREILDYRDGRRASHDRGWLMRRLLLLGDLLGLVLAFAAATRLIAPSPSPNLVPGLIFVCSLPLWVGLAKVYGLYGRDEERPDHSTADDVVAIFHVVTVGTWALFALSRLAGLNGPRIDAVVVFWALAMVLLPTCRAAGRTLGRRQLMYLQNTIVVGAGDVGQAVARKLLKRPELGINLVGFVDRAPRRLSGDLEHVRVLGAPEDLPGIMSLLDIDRVVIAFSQEAHEDTLGVVRMLSDLAVQVDIVPRLFEIVGPSVEIHTVEGLPLIGLPPLRLSPSALFVKRSIDVLGAGIGLLLAAPLLIAIAIAIKIDSRGPVFYRSERIGRNRRIFGLFKFRSMATEFCRGREYGGEAAEEEFRRIMSDPELQREYFSRHKLDADPRVTRLGGWLRRTSLDELPQLLNVIRGDISLVGPRPITTDEYEMIGGPERIGDDLLPSTHGVAGYWEVEDLRPGITGYWQITGRSEIGYAERVRLDTAYVKGWSLKLDSLILAKTLRVLVSARGAR